MRVDAPYCEMSSCSLWDIEKADLDETLDRKGYLINRLQMNRYSLYLWWKSSAAISCHRLLGMSQESIYKAGGETLCLVQIVHLGM